MQTLYSTLRLAAGCWALLGGIGLMNSPDLQYQVLGIVVGGMGMAVALQETAFVYARFMQAREDEPTGYDDGELDRWAGAVRGWAQGAHVDAHAYIGDQPAPVASRDVFAFMINGAKVRAPAAAQALIARIS